MTISAQREEEISLRSAWALVVRRRWFIIAVVIFTTLLSALSTKYITKRYEAEITLSPISSSGGSGQMGALGAMASQVGGLASLAGISLGGDSQKAETIAVLQSEALTEAYIRKNNLLPVLYAKKWDAASHSWKVKSQKEVPTLWGAYRFFGHGVRAVKTDAKTGLVTMTITWTDPGLAANWANGLVKMTNDYLRDKAIAEEERNISYLNDQASKTDSVSMKQVIYQLLQSEVNKAMLAKGNDEYALKVIDPAFAPERPSSPNLMIFAGVGLFVGLFFSMSWVILRDF